MRIIDVEYINNYILKIQFYTGKKVKINFKKWLCEINFWVFIVE